MPQKKILLVANTAWNHWNYRRALVRALEESGCQVVLAAPDDRFSALLEGISPNICFAALRQLTRRGLSPFQNGRAFLELYRLYRSERPAITILYTIKPNILGNLAARLAGIPSISVVEGLGYAGSFAARWRWLAAPAFRLALQRAQRVVFLNADDAREFLRLRLVRPEQSVMLPGPGVDTDHFQPVVKAESPEVVFLFCGRLLREKGIREFIEAARIVHPEYANAVFQVLGSPDPGNPASILPEEVRRWEQLEAVRLLGQADDVRPHLAAADVLVLPSYYREGVPRAVLEAMSMEKIIITTDTPGCRDTVEDGENGFFIPPQNPGALASCIRRILQLPPEKRLAMGRASRRRALERFSDKQVLPQYLKLIGELPQRQNRYRKPPPLQPM